MCTSAPDANPSDEPDGPGPQGESSQLTPADFALADRLMRDLEMRSQTWPRTRGGHLAIGMALLLFLIPTRSRGADARTLMGVEVFRDVPWNIVLLFGGGFALAKGFQATGLAPLIGSQLAGLASVPPFLAVAATCAFMTPICHKNNTKNMGPAGYRNGQYTSMGLPQ